MTPLSAAPEDHRVITARRKRQDMRARILDATLRVFARTHAGAPTIEDVVRESGISRGAFYLHFETLDQALVAAGLEVQNRMMSDINQVHEFLKEPWQRVAVGFRVFMVRAWRDPVWASFVTRLDTWQRNSRLGESIYRDLERGREAGQFDFENLIVCTEFVMSASAGTVQAFRYGVDDPVGYMDAAEHLLFRTLGASPELAGVAIAFARKHLEGWPNGKAQLSAWRLESGCGSASA